MQDSVGFVTTQKITVQLRPALLWITMLQVREVTDQHFRTTYQSHPQGSRIQKKACSTNTGFI